MKKTTLICTLILVSLLSGCAGNNASQPVSSQDTSVTSSASESTTESITTPETSVPEESTSSYEDEKFTALGVVDSSAEENKRDIASFGYNYGSEYKTPSKTTIDKMRRSVIKSLTMSRCKKRLPIFLKSVVSLKPSFTMQVTR